MKINLNFVTSINILLLLVGCSQYSDTYYSYGEYGGSNNKTALPPNSAVLTLNDDTAFIDIPNVSTTQYLVSQFNESGFTLKKENNVLVFRQLENKQLICIECVNYGLSMHWGTGSIFDL